eukprot:gene6517-8957_t
MHSLILIVSLFSSISILNCDGAYGHHHASLIPSNAYHTINEDLTHYTDQSLKRSSIMSVIIRRTSMKYYDLKLLCKIRGGFGIGGVIEQDDDDSDDDDLNVNNLNYTNETSLNTIEIKGAPQYIRKIEGIYYQTEWKMNEKPHFEREIIGDPNGEKIHLYWTGNQWVLHYDLDPSRNFGNLLAYSKRKSSDPISTSSFWNVKFDQSYEPSPKLDIGRPGAKSTTTVTSKPVAKSVDEFLGVPKQLFPLYIAFMLDAVATGLAMPLLPFYVMELGADAMQLSLVVSSNYVAQTIGCIVMGRISDIYGRKIVLLCCLLASSLSYFFISKATSLPMVAMARIVSGSFGGLIPIMQSSVADVSPVNDRPKYIGRIMATFGLGFVLGPALSAALPKFSTREKIQMAALLPLSGFLLSILFVRESKKNIKGSLGSKKTLTKSPKVNVQNTSSAPLSMEVMLLVLNGFLLMYAFATESIYAMFIKDSFGYGERVLSGLFAMNGMFIGIFQVFFIKPLINLIGKHATLALGDSILALGMIGVALIRVESIHFLLFAVHIVGYSIADTALASLISKYSSNSSQGKNLALNQAAQSCARVISPLIAGFLYELSKKHNHLLPSGALPFLAGAMCPAIAVAIPSLLYIRSVSNKRKLQAIKTEEESLKKS